MVKTSSLHNKSNYFCNTMMCLLMCQETMGKPLSSTVLIPGIHNMPYSPASSSDSTSSYKGKFKPALLQVGFLGHIVSKEGVQTDLQRQQQLPTGYIQQTRGPGIKNFAQRPHILHWIIWKKFYVSFSSPLRH